MENTTTVNLSDENYKDELWIVSHLKKCLNKFVLTYYPDTVRHILCVVSSEYDDERYSPYINAILAYDDNDELVPPKKEKAVECIQYLACPHYDSLFTIEEDYKKTSELPYDYYPPEFIALTIER